MLQCTTSRWLVYQSIVRYNNCCVMDSVWVCGMQDIARLHCSHTVKQTVSLLPTPRTTFFRLRAIKWLSDRQTKDRALEKWNCSFSNFHTVPNIPLVMFALWYCATLITVATQTSSSYCILNVLFSLSPSSVSVTTVIRRLSLSSWWLSTLVNIEIRPICVNRCPS